MTKLAVVAYPSLSPDDHAWLEAVRARHDPQASRVEAHFTLVFPAVLAVESLVGAVRDAVAGLGPIPVVLRRFIASRDPVAGGGHVFLLPEEGRTELLALHDRLYAGVLRPHLRADVPFEPHVTVAASPSLEECERITEDLGRTRRRVPGTVQAAEVIDVSAWTVRPVRHLPFEGRLR